MPLFKGRDDAADRSAAEREAARIERERRRAAREGRPFDETDVPPADATGPVDEGDGEAARSQHDDDGAPAEHADADAVHEVAGDDHPPVVEEHMPAEWETQPEPADDPAVADHGVPARDAPAEPVAREPYDPAVPDATGPHTGGAAAYEYAAADHRGPSSEPLHRQDGPVTEPFAPVTPRAHDAGHLDQPTAAFSPGDFEDDDDEFDDVVPPPGRGRPGRRTVSLPRPQADLAADDQHHETPIGTRRAGRPYVAQPGAAPPGHRQLTVRRPRARKGLIALIVLLLVVFGVAGAAAWAVFQPLHGEGEGSVRVTIPTGSTAREIGDRLAAAGVVDSGAIFGLRARIAGKRDELRAGTYKLKRNMSYAAAMEALSVIPKSVPVMNVTLPEGPSRRELVPLVKQAGIKGNYLKASAGSKKLNPRTYGAPRGSSLEGFLFPSTYELRRSRATAARLVAAQLAAFKANIAKVNFNAAKSKNLTRYDVLTIASMIEREARVPRERRLVAAVIYNRLKQGIPLGIDATIRYQTRNWTRPLRQSELTRDTPYNTRTRQGLPPGPIGNPGLASIRAAANPASNDYIFYVVKPCGNGSHNFSSTDAEFQRDVAAYNRKRDELGGKDPSTCKK